MRISVIAAIYKDIEALKIIIEALKNQTYANFELIVAEDNNDPAIADYLSTVNDIDILHTSQKDVGIQKARSQNNAIIKSTGDYLIFIDGDCIPYPNFVSSHAALAEDGSVLSGRRVNLGPRISQNIRSGLLNTSSLAKYYLLYIPWLWFDGTTHIGQGLPLSINGWIYKNIFANRKKSNTNILGCNFSCFKKDILNIDGFDESYGETALPDDTDIQWRFQASGLKLKSCKMIANVFHLHHPARQNQLTDGERHMKKMLIKKSIGDYVATTGISSHKENKNHL